MSGGTCTPSTTLLLKKFSARVASIMSAAKPRAFLKSGIRFTPGTMALADACARIGGDVGCYSFIAVDFHHILLASLPAHSLALRPAHSRCHQFVTRIPKASAISARK